MTTNDKLLEIAIRDLVKLSILSHNIVIQGQFPGAIADEVKELLDLTNHIVSTFTKDNNEAEKA